MKETNIWDTEALSRRVLPVIIKVDTSGSMEGAKISSTNTAIREVMSDMGEISKNNADAQVKIGVLEFSSGAKWMYDKLIEAESFQWQDLDAEGLTCFGAACEELNSKLSRSKGFLAEKNGVRTPVIILLSDGEPTDNWKPSLEKLKGNPWFQAACKIAIAIGDDADKNMLAEFTGSMEAVITVHNVQQLKAIIKTVSVTSTMINSQSSNAGNGMSANGAPAPAANPAQTVIAGVKDSVNSDPAMAGVDFGATPANTGKDDWNW